MSVYGIYNPFMPSTSFAAKICRGGDGAGGDGGSDGFQGPNADGSAGYSVHGDVAVSSGGTAYGPGEGGIGTGTASGTGYTGLADMFDGGGPGKSGDTFGNNAAVSAAADTNNDGHVSAAEAAAVGGLSGGIDGDSDSGLFGGGWDIGYSGNSGSNSGFNNGGGGEGNDSTYWRYQNDNVQTNGTINQDTSGTTDTTDTTDTTNTTDTTDTTDNTVVDNSDQIIADLQAQIDALSANQTPQVIYQDVSGGGGSSNTGLPDDYLTADDLEKYLGNLNTNSNAYDPAAFLNAYGFALQPGFEGDIIQTYLSPDGLYIRRAVRDRETGEIRYVNIPIAAGSMGNQGLNSWRQQRRTGFGTFV